MRRCAVTDYEQLEEHDEDSAPLVEPQGHRPFSTEHPSQIPSISLAAVQPLAPSTSTETTKSTTLNEQDHSGKLQRVLADHKIAALPIPDHLRKRLVEVVRKNLDAFAACPMDLGRTSDVIHTIKTGEESPFRHKLRAILFARRLYPEQEVERLISVGAISPADIGACPYASRTVVTLKKYGTMRMCVDNRDLNAQTENDSFPLPRIDEVWPTLARGSSRPSTY